MVAYNKGKLNILALQAEQTHGLHIDTNTQRYKYSITNEQIQMHKYTTGAKIFSVHSTWSGAQIVQIVATNLWADVSTETFCSSFLTVKSKDGAHVDVFNCLKRSRFETILSIGSDQYSNVDMCQHCILIFKKLI